MEWLWRGMTYGKFPSMHNEDSMPTIEAPPTSSVPITLPASGESKPNFL
jgi:hypothetical protein